MKAILVIFAIYINYVLSEGNKYAVKSFPKKVRPYGNGKILINSGKYELRTKPKPTTKSNKRTYTVFQVVGISKTIQGVPDSPYFPVDQTFGDHKPRVKKVLPDYPWSSLRSKRSAVLDAPPVEKDQKTETTKEENKLESKANVEDTTTRTTAEQKLTNKVEEPKSSKKDSPTLDFKQIEKTKEIKEETKSAVKVTDTDKPETTTEKSIERSGHSKSKHKNEKKGDSKHSAKSEPKPAKKEESKKVDRKGDSKTVKKEELKEEKKVEPKVNKTEVKPEPKVEIKTKNTEPAKTLKSKLADTRTAFHVKKKTKNKDTTDVTTLKDKETKEVTNNTNAKSKSKDGTTEAAVFRSKVKATPPATSVKEISSVKATETSTTSVKPKTKPKARERKHKVSSARVKTPSNSTKSKNKKKSSKIHRTNKRKVTKRKGHNNQTASGKRVKKKRSRSKTLKGKPRNGTRPSLKAERRLIAAREALIDSYPYVVSIQKNDEHWCSGALLNPRLVITTANCLWKASSISRMEVRAGSRFVDRGGQMAGIQEVMKHPGWGLRKSPDNDVALILLDRNIKFSDTVHGVDLPNRVMLPPFDDAWVTSWGSERRDGVYDTESTSLQVYHTRLISREKCNNVTMRFSVIVTENFICLAQSGRTAPCTRDTGAPAVSDGVLWGLASWGIRKLCGTERFPAVFSYLASHSNMDFISNATHSLMGDKRFYPYGDRFPKLRKPDSESSVELKAP